MLADSHRQEALSKAFVTAIAAKAGIKCVLQSDQDVGIDGYFKLVKPLETLRTRKLTPRQSLQLVPPDPVPLSLLREFGMGLDFQLKSSTTCNIRSNDVKYAAEPDDYDKLVDPDRTTPILLIVCALPSEEDWLMVEHDHTKLGGRCFYYFPTGPLTTNRGSITITIPKTNLLNSDSLKQVIEDYHKSYRIEAVADKSDVQL